MILSLRTDKPEAEIGLYDKDQKAAELIWLAGRELSADIHLKIDEVFKSQNITYDDLTGVVFYKGPGSFTGLRLGASVANTIAHELDIPIAAAGGDNWLDQGLALLRSQPGQRTVLPDYGAPPKTTTPKK